MSRARLTEVGVGSYYWAEPDRLWKFRLNAGLESRSFLLKKGSEMAVIILEEVQSDGSLAVNLQGRECKQREQLFCVYWIILGFH